MKKNVLLGMSSGIDSSVSAILLKQRGFEVTGVTFIFSGNDVQNNEIVSASKNIAESLGITHYTIDLRNEFNDFVVSYFLNEYAAGRTPFPCAVCNPDVKFRNLVKYSTIFGCTYIATGHYAQITEKENFSYISKGIDSEKEQSFFLWGLSQNVIKRLVLPLGKIEKPEVRKIAKKFGFPSLIKKSESVGICFIEGGDYRQFLKKKGIGGEPGNFLNRKGEIIGKHNGFVNYTVGQRRGLGLNFNTPLFVSEIRPETDEVVLSEFNGLKKSVIYLHDCHFVNTQSINNQITYIVKIRYRLQETPCNIEIVEGNRAIIKLAEPVFMVAEGQTAVFYEGERVIGGGFIEKSE